MGLRIRLKAVPAGLPTQAHIVAQAMATYGMILADNGSDYYFQGDDDACRDVGQTAALGVQRPLSGFLDLGVNAQRNAPEPRRQQTEQRHQQQTQQLQQRHEQQQQRLQQRQAPPSRSEGKPPKR